MTPIPVKYTRKVIREVVPPPNEVVPHPDLRESLYYLKCLSVMMVFPVIIMTVILTATGHIPQPITRACGWAISQICMIGGQ